MASNGYAIYRNICKDQVTAREFSSIQSEVSPRNTNYSRMVSIVLPALLSSLECVLLLLRYCQFYKLFYCYCATANYTIVNCYCATANFTICSSATVTALLPTSQFVLLLMCYCATANFTNSSYCATSLLPTSQIYLTALLRYC